jgi:hypothetical protein
MTKTNKEALNETLILIKYFIYALAILVPIIVFGFLSSYLMNKYDFYSLLILVPLLFLMIFLFNKYLD